MLVVVLLIFGLSTIGAVGLTSRIPAMRLQASASYITKVLRSAREQALEGGKCYKVRFYQSARATGREDLFLDDLETGVKQYYIAMPVEAWAQMQLAWSPPCDGTDPAGATATDILPGAVFPFKTDEDDASPPTDVSPQDRFDYETYPHASVIVPIMRIDEDQIAGSGGNFLSSTDFWIWPTDASGFRLSEREELPGSVRITAVNRENTYGQSTNYSTLAPGNKVPNPTCPKASSDKEDGDQIPWNSYDERIADVTYSPDGNFSFYPQPNGLAKEDDFTIRLQVENLTSAPAGEAESLTIHIDRHTGIPWY